MRAYVGAAFINADGVDWERLDDALSQLVGRHVMAYGGCENAKWSHDHGVNQFAHVNVPLLKAALAIDPQRTITELARAIRIGLKGVGA